MLFHFGLELLQSLVLTLEDVLLPDEHLVELAVGHHHLVHLAQVLRFIVHNTQHPKAVALDGLDGVAVQRE